MPTADKRECVVVYWYSIQYKKCNLYTAVDTPAKAAWEMPTADHGISPMSSEQRQTKKKTITEGIGEMPTADHGISPMPSVQFSVVQKVAILRR